MSKQKLKLNDLKVQSFVTVLSGNNLEQGIGGAQGWTDDPCPTFDDAPICATNNPAYCYETDSCPDSTGCPQDTKGCWSSMCT